MSELSNDERLELILAYYLLWKIKKQPQVTRRVTRYVQPITKVEGLQTLAGSSIADLGTKDHDLLDGLLDDDHTQYLLANGLRYMAGNLYPDGDLTRNLGTVTVVDGSRRRWDVIAGRRIDCFYIYGYASPFSIYSDDTAASELRFYSHDGSAYRISAKLLGGHMEFYDYSGGGYQLCGQLTGGVMDVLRGGNITMLAQKMFQFGTYTDAQRPAAGAAGRVIFNTDDGMPNYDDGTNWRDINGNIT